MIVFERTCPLEQRARALDLGVRVGAPTSAKDGDLVIPAAHLDSPMRYEIHSKLFLKRGDGIQVQAVTWFREGAPLLPQLLGQVIFSQFQDLAWCQNVGFRPMLHRHAHRRAWGDLGEVSGPVAVHLELGPSREHLPAWLGLELATSGILGFAVAGLVDELGKSLELVYGKKAYGGELSLRSGCCAALRFYPDEPDEVVGYPNSIIDPEVPESIVLLGRGPDPCQAIHAAVELARRFGATLEVSDLALEAKRDLGRALRRLGGGPR